MKKALSHGWSIRIVVLIVVASVGVAACASSQSKEEEKIKDAQWHFKMGQGYFESHEIPLAIKALHKTLQLDPEHAKAHHLMGLVYMGRRDYTKALNHLNEALRLEPDFHIARNNRGSIYLAMERWRDAQRDFQTLIEEPLYATPELAHNNLAWAYYNRRKYSEALRHYEMATFLKPQLCLAHNGMGLTYLAMGNHSQAFESFRSALKRCPNNYAEPHFNIGKMLQKRGDMRNAVQHFRACRRIEPSTNLGRRCEEYLRVMQ